MPEEQTSTHTKAQQNGEHTSPSVDCGWAEGLPNNCFANVGSNEQRDSLGKTQQKAPIRLVGRKKVQKLR